MRRFLALSLFLLAFACAAPPPPPPEVAPEPPTAAPGPAGEPVIGTVRVTASTLNVRRDPATTAEVIVQVKKGQRLPLLASTEGWMKVRTPKGESGWVSSQHVRREEPRAASRSRRKSCPADAEFSFVKAPMPSFSDSGSHGVVVVEATVNTSGDVMSTKLVSNTTGDEALAFLTEREIKSAKFVAPIRNCVPRVFIFTYTRSF